MKYVTTRDLRNRPGFVREVAREDDLVLTANGQPFAILVAVEEGELEETARAIRQAKAQQAVSRLRRQAARRGLDKLSPRAVDAEIRAARVASRACSPRRVQNGHMARKHGQAAHRAAREGAARGDGAPQATEPGCGAEPHARSKRSRS